MNSQKNRSTKLEHTYRLNVNSCNTKTHYKIIQKNLNTSYWEIRKDKCVSTRAHGRHLEAHGKSDNKQNIYCTNVYLKIIDILMTIVYKLSAVIMMPLQNIR